MRLLFNNFGKFLSRHAQKKSNRVDVPSTLSNIVHQYCRMFKHAPISMDVHEHQCCSTLVDFCRDMLANKNHTVWTSVEALSTIVHQCCRMFTNVQACCYFHGCHEHQCRSTNVASCRWGFTIGLTNDVSDMCEKIARKKYEFAQKN